MSNVTDRPEDVEFEDDNGGDSPRLGPWVSAYRFLHRFVRHRGAVFGGTAGVGAMALAGWVAALVLDSSMPSLPYEVGGVGALLFGFGSGYYVARHESTCEECDAPFSREQVGKRPVGREVRGRDRTYVEHIYECRNCGRRTTDARPQPEPNYPLN